MTVAIIIGTRPEIIKMAPIIKKLSEKKELLLIHTGQHYSFNVDELFFQELELPTPDIQFEVGKTTKLQGAQTAEMIRLIEEALIEQKPKAVLVQGDTNTVLAGAIAASKLFIPIGHVEAGLRSRQKIPEEINRVLTDHISEWLFVPTEEAKDNLISEGIDSKRIFITGNTIVDAINQFIPVSQEKSSILTNHGLTEEEFILVTLHRQENVDNPDVLSELISVIKSLADEYKIIFPIHHRTKSRIEEFQMTQQLSHENLYVIDPVGYLDMIRLLSSAKLVITDSGGIQEEAIIVNTPCVTARDATERPETITAGGNILGGIEKASLLEIIRDILTDKEKLEKMKKARNPFGDGAASDKIIAILEDL